MTPGGDPEVGHVRHSSGPSKEVRAALGCKICAADARGPAPKAQAGKAGPAPSRSVKKPKKNPRAQPSPEGCTDGVTGNRRPPRVEQLHDLGRASQVEMVPPALYLAGVFLAGVLVGYVIRAFISARRRARAGRRRNDFEES